MFGEARENEKKIAFGESNVRFLLEKGSCLEEKRTLRMKEEIVFGEARKKEKVAGGENTIEFLSQKGS